MPVGRTGWKPILRLPIARENVSVQVDPHEIVAYTVSADFICAEKSGRYSDFMGCGFSTFRPHFLQVRRASSFQNSSIAWLKCSTMSLQSK
jgi:hypothetical protein